MSKRLNKRQQRLEQEAQHLQAAPAVAPLRAEESEGEHESAPASAQANAFAALNNGQDELAEDDEDDDDSGIEAPAKKSSSRKKKKKKAKASAPESSAAPGSEGPTGVASSVGSTPARGKAKESKGQDDGMDEVDRALAELRLKFGDDLKSEGSEEAVASRPEASSSASSLALRNLLSVEVKNLDADAELRKFFGSKVVAGTSSSSSKRHTSLKTHLAKPKPNWPPPNSFLGLGMRELTSAEVQAKRDRIGASGLRGEPLGSERWWSFEHGGGWREAQRQFMGAIQSHDPNQLFALLQVFPYHTDTILQMGEVYRQQSDLGQASEFIDRALFAFERAFAPGFSITQGNVRLDFDRVENRGFYLALIRNLQFLGRRGCWTTSFTFAKLLLAMDPHADPQGSLLWLDFLAIKSSNHSWLLSFLRSYKVAMSDLGWSPKDQERIELSALPGMAYARALALRAEELSKKDTEHKDSAAALRDAVLAFPYVLPLLADKVGFSIPSEHRQNPLFERRLGYEPGGLTTLHLLSHIYVLRSQALWKELPTLAWLQSQLPGILSELASTPSYAPREAAVDHFKLGTPESIVRHVLVAEDNSTLLGFIDKRITSAVSMSFDPLPPSTSISAYNNEYFMGQLARSGEGGGPRRRGGGAAQSERGEGGGGGEDGGLLQAIINSLMNWGGGGGDAEAGQGGGMGELAARLREMLAGGDNVADEDREALMAQLMGLAQDQEDEDEEQPPGAFPA